MHTSLLVCSWVLAPWRVINSIIETITTIKFCCEGGKIAESIRLCTTLCVASNSWQRKFPIIWGFCLIITKYKIVSNISLHSVQFFFISICRENHFPTAVVSHQTQVNVLPIHRTAGFMDNPLMAVKVLVTSQWQDHAQKFTATNYSSQVFD